MHLLYAFQNVVTIVLWNLHIKKNRKTAAKIGVKYFFFENLLEVTLFVYDFSKK